MRNKKQAGLARQKHVFESVKRRAAQPQVIAWFTGQNLATIGESLCVYVPRLVREHCFESFLALSYEEIGSVYGSGSWAIDDLIRLLERIADKAGATTSDDGPEAAQVSQELDTTVGCEPAAPVFSNDRNAATVTVLDQVSAACWNDDAMRSEFELMRQVLHTHATHLLLDEELREFLEPRDTDIPTEFLGNSVREVLETPFERVARRWVGRGRVRCLLNLLGRAVASIQSLTGHPEEDTTAADIPLRTHSNSVAREISDDGKSWRQWCDSVHGYGLQRLLLGTVADCLRDLPANLWHRPLSDFTSFTLRQLAGMPDAGPKQREMVIESVRRLALDLQGLPQGTNVCVKLIPGPLRNAQDWIERTLEARIVPDMDELTVRLLRPLAWQLQHDLPEREAQIAIRRLQLDESSGKSTLEELGAIYGVSRERIRHLEQCGPRVLKVRFSQGRYLLEALHGQLVAVPGAHRQASFVRRIASLCFESEAILQTDSNDVVSAWDEAGRLKLTPMTGEQVLEWSKNRLPTFPPGAVLEAVRSQALCWQPDGRAPLFFARTEIDRILFVLQQQRAPVRLAELVLLDRIQNGDSLAEHELTSNFDADDERSLWGRIRRDSRFVECDDHHQLLPSTSCGFERLDGQWIIRLNPTNNSSSESRRHLPVDAIVRLVADGLTQRGIVDATVAGVHRFASEVLSKMFRASLPDDVTPLVLSDMLVKLSDGLIRSMRRRRLRWDGASSGLVARGKRGWVGHVVTEFGRPLVLSELDALLRKHFQDYADYVINQLATISDEDGEVAERVQFVSELGHGIPTLVVPTSWTLDSVQDNVSQEILEVVRRLVRQVQSGRLALGEFKSVVWMMTLVERHKFAKADTSGEREAPIKSQPPASNRKLGMYPITVTRIGSTRMPRCDPISAFILIHGQHVDGTINRNGKSILCAQCKGTITPGDSYAVEDIEHDGLRLLLFLHDASMRRWCLGCIDYSQVTEVQAASTPDDPVVLKFSRGKLQARTVAPTSDEPSPTTATVVLSAKDLGELHLTVDDSRVLAAELEQPFENLFGYAFTRILACKPAYRPWSLAELSLVEADVEWLRALFERTTATALRSFLSGPSRFEGYSPDAQLGAILLLLESELARRHASEGMLWSAIHQQMTWRDDASRFLFNHRQPNARHKACLEAAAKELGLRCAFGEDSAQEWYQSVFLQCGFSKKSFEGRLTQWLSGENTPVSVARLLGNDARYSSVSFTTMWAALRDYRHGSLDRDGLKRALGASPWVLPEWHDSLMQLSRTERHSSAAEDDRIDESVSAGKQPTPGGSSDLAADTRFLTEPRVRWSNGVLQFVCEVNLSESLDLEDDVDVVIGGQVMSRLIMQSDGSFDATQSEIDLPTISSSVAAELRSLSEIAVATQTLTLWDGAEDVDGYVLKAGRRIDPSSREFSERETLLIYSADLRIEPARPSVAVLGNGSRHVVRLLPLETVNTRLFLGNDLLWEPDAPIHPAWRDRVRTDVELRPRKAPTQFRIRVLHPSDVTATAIRLRRKLLELQHDSGSSSCSAWLPLDPELRIAESIAVTVLLRKGDETTELRRRVPLRLPGHLWRRSDVWEPVPSRLTCELRELQQAEFRLSPPESEIKGDRWQLFEGRRWIGAVQERPQRITAVEGWGAPLVLRAAPYNCCQYEQPLLQGLTNRGEIRDVEFGPDGAVTISLHRPITPDESHAVVVFDELGEMTFFAGADLADRRQDDSTATVWKMSLLRGINDQRILALAIAYNGERLGSWWQHDWTDVFRQPANLADGDVARWASGVADGLRWLHLPLLSRNDGPHLREFAKAFAVPVMTAWLSQRVSRRLIHDAVGEGWLCVVRAVLADWQPTAEEARTLDASLERLLSDGNDLLLKTTTMALVGVSPLLAARFVRVRLASDFSDAAAIKQLRAVITAIKRQLLGRDSTEDLVLRVARDVAWDMTRAADPPVGTLDFVRDSLLAKSLHLDRSTKTNINELDRSNIEVAMRLDAFRSLVLVACLDRIGKELL